MSVPLKWMVLVLALWLLSTSAALAEDADTMKLDGKTFRLDGIDAPESDQRCIDENARDWACGGEAYRQLMAFVAGRPIRCDDLGTDPAYPRRRIGRCTVDGSDLHRWLVSEGWALNFEPYARGRFQEDEDNARANLRGMWRGCFVAPRDFRRWNKQSARLMGNGCTEDVRSRLFPDEPEMPPGCEIKGTFRWRALPYRGIYHLPGCRSYRPTKPNRWFCSEEDAWAAGFRKAFTCPRR